LIALLGFRLFASFGMVFPAVGIQRGATALMKASGSGYIKIVQLLLEAGADKDAKDEVGKREKKTHV
jgi:hypothetical protein